MKEHKVVSLRLRGALWLLLLAPLFFLTYGQVNIFTATRHDVSHFAFYWEDRIPFLPWTIIPYWNIDVLYGLSLFICTSRKELFRHGLRLLAASLIACTGFLLFPLQFSWRRPDIEGVFGWLFMQLEQFDLPYNQAPSLHIILAWLLWLRFRSHLSGIGRSIATGWFILIAVSVLTTWQHHCIDIVSGFIVGVLISYMIPMQGSWRWCRYTYPSNAIIGRYAGGVLLCSLLAVILPYGVILLWPALSLLLMMLAHLGAAESVWQKDDRGRVSLSARILMLPIRAVNVIVHNYHRRRYSPYDDINYGLSIGSYPTKEIVHSAVLDLTSEYSTSRKWIGSAETVSSPFLDLQVPQLEKLHHAVMQLDSLKIRHDTVLIHCALGMSRSALVAAGWLIYRGHAGGVEQAVDMILQRRRCVHLTPRHLELLEKFRETVHG